MPQTFQVLRCFQCLVFQVHPTKKANKWKCNMCGEKQSIKRFYGLGTGKECRLHVQRLNGIQGEIHNSKLKTEDSDQTSDSQDETASDSYDQSKTVPKAIKKSKWADYVDMDEENEHQILNEAMHPNEAEVLLQLPKKRPRKTQHVINTPDPLSSENKCDLSTRVKTKDKTVESKRFNKSIKNLGRCDLIDLPAETEIHKNNDLLPSLSNSKWAQYIEETEIPNNENPTINDPNDLHDAPKIFSLVDDDNFDAILDF